MAKYSCASWQCRRKVIYLQKRTFVRFMKLKIAVSATGIVLSVIYGKRRRSIRGDASAVLYIYTSQKQMNAEKNNRAEPIGTGRVTQKGPDHNWTIGSLILRTTDATKPCSSSTNLNLRIQTQQAGAAVPPRANLLQSYPGLRTRSHPPGRCFADTSRTTPR